MSNISRLASLTLRLDQSLQRPTWLLWGLFGTLLAFYFSLTVKAGYSYDHISAASLGFSAILYRLWQRRQCLQYVHQPLTWWIGLLLLVWAIGKSLTMQETDTFLRLLPVIIAMGFGLMVVGLWGLRQFWLEALILLFFQVSTMPGVITPEVIHTSELTAKITSFMLSSVGFAALHQGINVVLPQASVAVLGPCSPTIPIVRLLEMTIFFIAIYPTTWLQRFVLPLAAILIAVVVNSVRIGILAVVNANKDIVAFDYWHHGTGSHIFSIANVIIFWLFWEALNQVPTWMQQLATAGQRVEEV